MLRKLFVAGSAMLVFSSQVLSQDVASLTSTTTTTATAKAEEPEKKPFLTISGSADVYYRHDFSKQVNSFTSFTGTHNSFKLGMASVKFEHKSDKVSVVADLGFGPRAKEFAYTDEGITQAIKQLYVSYSPAEWVKFTAGSLGNTCWIRTSGSSVKS